MKQLLIGDVHFGKYNNSPIWLESQMKFLNNDIVGLLNNDEDIDTIIFLGDLFDIRYSTNTLVGITAKEYITKLSTLFPNRNIYICGGNHDYYSPLEETKKYNVYNLVFGEEYSKCHPNVHIVWEKYTFINDNNGVIIPWYDWENQETLLDIIDKCKEGMTLYAHTDLENLDPDIENLIRVRGLTVMSGHIHYPKYKVLNSKSALYGLGACLPLDFSDVNSNRFVYICENNKILSKYTNRTTIQFKRFIDEEIFNITEKDLVNTRTQLCISVSNQDQARYKERIKELKSMNIDGYYDVSTQVIDDNYNFEHIDGKIVTNIVSYIEENIPNHLKSKYIKVKNKLNENK